MELQLFSGPLTILTAALATVAVSCSTVEAPPASLSSLACYLSFAGVSSSGDTFVLLYDEDSGRLDGFTCRKGIPANLQASSSNGPKRAVAIANVPEDLLSSDNINSYESLRDFCLCFSDEDPAHPAMSGETSFYASGGKTINITLTPLMSRIEIRSLKIDFSAQKGYSGKTLEKVRAYIINANGRCPLLAEGPVRATEILCQGHFSPADSEGLLHPEMLCADPREGCTLFCYPCSAVPSLCITRLVIEGELDGKVYYYPIDICPGPGVPRGRRLIYDITITRKGSPDPDTPVQDGAASVSWEVLDWTENENEIVYF